MKTNDLRKRMLEAGSALRVLALVGAGAAGTLAATPVAAQDADEGEAIIVTGTRISRPNLEASSPVTVVTGDDTVAHADITLDTFLNTLPQANPAGTSTSNNPGNGGQSNIDLRGLGSNRNIVLIDGRRPMVSSSSQTVDLNTIPQALIDRIEVVTGGAGATYGADAIAGVVNLRLKDNFEGLDVRATYSNAIAEMDAEEYRISGTIGGNFADGRGNIAISAEYAEREGLIKAQRPFAAQASSTTGTPPVGRFVENTTNVTPQSVVNAVWAGYGVAADQAPISGNGQILFNTDGTLFGGGVFNSPLDVSNYRYDPLGTDAAGANQNFFPDFYSYNFDAINLLVLPLKRKSAFMRAHYEVSDAFEFFTQAGYTEYNSATALAPTPISTRIYNSSSAHSDSYAESPLIVPGKFISNSLVPITNPFIPADLATILAARTGDDPNIVGAGATEPFRISIRTLGTGLRQTDTHNRVLQGLVGGRGEIADGWRYEAYYSWGETTIDDAASGNVNVQNLQALLEAPDGGASLCEGGFNPFGTNPLSADCVSYLDETGFTKTKFTQKIAQAYVTGDLAELPAGTLSVVAGVESRRFRYSFDAGALSGPIAGFNTSTNDLGTNSFLDFFGELYVPILDTLNLTLGYRNSKSDFNDIENGIDGQSKHSDAYKAELSWDVTDNVRLRGSYQRAVRAPNFGELFSGGSSFVQVFDPCSVTTQFRVTGGADARQLCIDTGVAASGVDTFVATPGAQIGLGFAGNPNLNPEKADTITGGVVFDWNGFTGSLDYYNISIKDPIFGPDTNMFMAACYGYVGDFTQEQRDSYCSGVVRAGSVMSFVAVPPELGGDSNSNFLLINQGKIKTSGVDFQVGYQLPTDFVSPSSRLNLGLNINYLIDYKVQELPGVTLDYAGTVSYFGAALGSSFPDWKGNLNLDWQLKPVTFSTRIRYIDGMKNRASVQFPGEVDFTGTPAVWYFDFALGAEVDNMSFRIGLNNAFNKKPPLYTPNVQSGTDPSLFDVVGRRAYISVGLKY